MGAHQNQPRGRTRGILDHVFLGKIDFEAFTSTYSEFDTDHENGLLFWIWGFCRCGEHLKLGILKSEFCMPKEKFREMAQASIRSAPCSYSHWKLSSATFYLPAWACQLDQIYDTADFFEIGNMDSH